jgi:hypothetical protein
MCATGRTTSSVTALSCPPEVRQKIAVQRAQKIRQDRGGDTAGGGEPSLRTPYSPPSINGIAPRPASQPPRPSYMPTPTRGPRPRYTGGGRPQQAYTSGGRPQQAYTGGGRPQQAYTGGGLPQQAPSVVSHVQQDEPRPTEEEFNLETPMAKNLAGDV